MQPMRNGKVTAYTASPHELCGGALRQAKRLRDCLQIPLTSAKDVLAKGPYRCGSWDDLQARIETRKASDHVIYLASMPTSQKASAYFSQNIDSIARSISHHVLTNANLLGLYDLAAALFSVTPTEHSLADIAASLPTSDWVASGIGPDPWAVMYRSAFIDNTPLLLVATRVYMPAYFNFRESVTAEPWLAEPTGEKFKILWSDAQQWYNAALTYLTIDDDDLELTLPAEPNLDLRMKEHKTWFELATSTLHGEGRYTEPNEDTPLPYLTSEGSYLVFGFPTSASTVNLLNADPTAPYDSRRKDGLLTINGQAMCLDVARYIPDTMADPERADDDAKTLMHTIFAHPACDIGLVSRRETKQLLAIRPASYYDVERFLRIELQAEVGEEVLVLKTDEPSIALSVIEDVSRRNLQSFTSQFDNQMLIMELDVSRFDELSGFSLGLELRQAGYFHSAGLVGRTITSGRKGKRTLLLEISPTLVALIERLGKKIVSNAVQYGLVIRRPAGFTLELERVPKWTKALAPAREEVVESFERSPFADGDMPMFDIFRHMRRIRYQRDNF